MPIVDSVVGASPACRDSIDDQTELGPHVLCRNIASDAFGSHFYVDGHSDEIVSFAKDGQRYVRASALTRKRGVQPRWLPRTVARCLRFRPLRNDSSCSPLTPA